MQQRHGRREFIGLTGAGIAGAAGAQWFGAASAAAQAVDAHDVDLVVFNAKVFTMDERTSRAEAFAVKSGRFVAVGSTADIKGLAGSGTKTFDAKQMAIVPGFIDCHNHAGGTTLLYEVLVGNPFEVEFVTIRSIVDKLRARARETPPGTWVEGYFFDDTKVKISGCSTSCGGGGGGAAAASRGGGGGGWWWWSWMVVGGGGGGGGGGGPWPWRWAMGRAVRRWRRRWAGPWAGP